MVKSVDKVINKKREGLSKRARFEVFKRDKFTCQYCGEKAPDVLLHVDHIEPVAKGGTNEIINLITSCQDCNLGKSSKRLSDNSALDKQRKQMESLQERREQIELMFEWKKSLSNLDRETMEMVKDYAHAKIKPFTINENGESSMKSLLRRYGIEEILDAIDISSETYLKYENGELTKESAEKFLDKIGGIIFNRRKTPIDQKLTQIKNKASSGLSYFNIRTGSILLNQYVKALRDYWKYNDDQIMSDLDNELIPKLDEKRNWTEWKDLLEGWVQDIGKKPEKEFSASTNLESFTKEEIGRLVQGKINILTETFIVLDHILKPYPAYNRKRFEMTLCDILIAFIEKQKELSAEGLKDIEKEDYGKDLFIADFTYNKDLTAYWKYDHNVLFDQVGKSKKHAEKLRLFLGMESVIEYIIDKLFEEQFYLGFDYSQEDLQRIQDSILYKLRELKGEEVSL